MNEHNLKNEAIVDEKTIKKIIPLLSLTIFFSVINNTMFNVALPAISQQFQLMPSEVSWVAMGFIVLFALSAIIFGKLADMYPVKYLISVGLIIFNIGLIIGFFSKWYWMLLIARYIQACGSGAIPALMMIVATRYVPIENRGKALGVIVSTIAFGTGIGTILGGFITSIFGWNYLFILSSLSLFSIYFYHKWLPTIEAKRGVLDIKGAILLALFIASLLFIINQLIWWLVPISGLLLWLFWKHISNVPEPFMQPQLLKNKKFSRGLLATFLTVGTFMATLFFVPLMLTELYAFNSAQIGLLIFPAAMSAAILGTYSGKFADRIGSVPVVYTGMAMLGVSFLLLSTFAGYTPMIISFILVITYVGFTTIQAAMANTISRLLPSEQVGVGMGLYNLVYYISGALYTAISGKALDYANSTIKLNPLLAYDKAAMYSNIGVAFIVSILLGFMLFYYTFQAKSTDVNL